MACCPYQDPILITAQVLSVLAFLGGSGGFYATLICGLIAMTILLCAACCEMGPCAFHTAALFCCFAVIGEILVLIYRDEILEYCNDAVDEAQDQDEINDDAFQDFCSDAFLTSIATIGLVFWSLTAVLTWIFVCVRLPNAKRRESQLPANRPAPTPQYPNRPVASPTTRVTHLPDGTKQIEKHTYNPDGSITVDVTTQAP